MAVGLPAALSSKTSDRKPSHFVARTPTLSEQMTAIMSYQYPLPPAPDVDISTSGFVNNYQLPAPTPPHSQAINKSPPARRSISGPSKVGKMKRSSSSPNVRGQARADQTESAFISLADDKRRNKLGYHRTSVACGHCRRRKIRCIPAGGDPQSRCSNCIRLKKECHFHPVDQQTEAGSASRRGSQVQGTVGGRSPSSSPSNGTAQAPEIQNTLPYPHMSIPPIHDISSSQIKRSRNESFSPENKAQLGLRGPEYGHPPSGWVPNDLPPMVKGSSDMSSSYWRMNSNEPPLTPAFSPFTPNLQLSSHPTWSHPAAEPHAREELGWHVPQRSMSFSNHDALPHPSSYPTFSHGSSDPNARDDFAPRQASQQHEVYAPALTPASVSTSTAEASLSATSADAIPHPSGPSALPPMFPNPQSWQPYPYKGPTLSSSGEPFPGWYSQNSSLPSHPHGGEGMPPTTYGHVDSYAGIYYPNATQGGR